MDIFTRQPLFIVLLTFLLGLSPTFSHASQLSEAIEYDCQLDELQRAIDCAYRFTQPLVTNKINASLADQTLPIIDIKTYPFEQSQTSILFLIENQSDDDADRITAIKQHLQQIIEQALDYQTIGLASFANHLRVIKPIGTDHEEISIAINEISPSEQVAFLNQNLLAAIDLMRQQPANRKAIYLLTSRHDQKQQVSDQQVISSAKQAGIKIFILAYPANSDHNQSLQNLSQLTGGQMIPIDAPDLELTDSFLSDPFALIDNGGILSLDLNPILSDRFQGSQLAVLNFETPQKQLRLKIPLQISLSEDGFVSVKLNGETEVEMEQIEAEPNEPSFAQTHSEDDNPPVESDSISVQVEAQVEAEVQPETQAKAQPEAQAETQAEAPSVHELSATITSKINASLETIGSLFNELVMNLKSHGYKEQLLNYWPVIPASILLIGLLYILLHKKPDNEPEVVQLDNKKAEQKPYAWLVSLTDDRLSYPLSHQLTTIGRTHDNDMIVDHASVSRKHAQISKNDKNRLVISDLDSLNGVYINNRKVNSAVIEHDDRVDIGDVRLRLIVKS